MKAGQRLKSKNPMKDISMIISEINFRNKEFELYPYIKISLHDGDVDCALK